MLCTECFTTIARKKKKAAFRLTEGSLIVPPFEGRNSLQNIKNILSVNDVKDDGDDNDDDDIDDDDDCDDVDKGKTSSH